MSVAGKMALYRRIRNWAKENNRGILDVLEDCVSGDLVVPYTYALVKRYGEIKEKLDGIRKEPKQLLTLCCRKGESYAEILNRVIEESESRRGQSDWLPGIRREVLNEVFSPEAAAPSDRVRVMSLHAAKGLSAPMVVVMSAVEGLIPRKGKDSVEEQRRLFYVAVTRCKAGESGAYPGKVIISAYTHSEDGEREYSPSRFIRERDEALP